MGLKHEAAAAICEMGEACAEDIADRFPALDIKQVQRAVWNAVGDRLIVQVGRRRVPGTRAASRAVYAARRPADPAPSMTRVSCVWELGRLAALEAR